MNKYFLILDTKSNKPIFIDKAIKEKLSNPCISFDNKYFFKLSGTKNYKVKELNYKPDLIIPFNYKDIPDYYKIILWRDNEKILDADVYREFDITELDKEVINLVNALNTIPGLETTGSCSGHNKNYLYVDIKFSNIESLKNLIYILQDNELYKFFNISTDKHIRNNEHDGDKVILKLNSLQIGQEAYKNADNLANIITKRYKDVF